MRRAAGRVAAAALLAAAAITCGGGDSPATSNEECKARSTCRTHGRCSLDFKTKKCVVGSDQDCANSNLCHKDNLCKKVGESCGGQP